jgi:ubiquinone/menaquinone biosynthesis C-methylase UbiE
MASARNTRFWDKSAPRYAKQPVKDMASYETALDRTRAYLAGDDEVLEIGCGTGTTALKLAPNVRRITASDVSPVMIEIAEGKARDESASNADFFSGTVADTRLDGRTFDAVLAFNLLHLVDDLPATLARVAALVEPGGYFIAKTVCLDGQGWYFKPMIRLMQAVRKAPFVAFLTIDGLERAVRDAGFEIVESGDYPANPPSRFIVARKV